MRQFFALVEEDFRVPKAELGEPAFEAVLKIVFGLIAAVAVLVLVIAGLKYVLSRGDAGEVAKAKNTIIYALVGVVIAAAAFSIVSFVAERV